MSGKITGINTDDTENNRRAQRQEVWNRAKELFYAMDTDSGTGLNDASVTQWQGKTIYRVDRDKLEDFLKQSNATQAHFVGMRIASEIGGDTSVGNTVLLSRTFVDGLGGLGAQKKFQVINFGNQAENTGQIEIGADDVEVVDDSVLALPTIEQLPGIETETKTEEAKKKEEGLSPEMKGNVTKFDKSEKGGPPRTISVAQRTQTRAGLIFSLILEELRKREKKFRRDQEERHEQGIEEDKRIAKEDINKQLQRKNDEERKNIISDDNEEERSNAQNKGETPPPNRTNTQ